MHVSHLSLTDFRCYGTADIGLEPGVTAFVGPNGQGKTNLVEAVGYVSTLGSHRVPVDAPLVRQGASRAVVRTAVERGGRRQRVDLEIVARGANRAQLNQAPVRRMREVLGVLRTVLFGPEDLMLVKGDPDARRRFLDDVLVSRAPRFAGVKAEFERVLKQRNASLKSAAGALRAGRADVRTLDVWDEQFAQLGAELLHGRLHLVNLLREPVAGAYARVAPGAAVAALRYRSSLGDDIGTGGLPGRDLLQARFLEALAKARGQEIDRGLSLVGPQRDDVVLTLGDFPAKGYASHGESWSFALALRLGSYDLLRDDPGPDGDGEPVLILDDVFAELDARRRAALVDVVAGAEQVLITAAVPEDVPEGLGGARFDVFAGEVRRVC